MKEYREAFVRVGFRRKPKKVLDEVEAITADMIRQGWNLHNHYMEDGLEKIHLIFERETDRRADSQGE